MISLILLKLFTFSQILQGVPKLLHATVYESFVCMNLYNVIRTEVFRVLYDLYVLQHINEIVQIHINFLKS